MACGTLAKVCGHSRSLPSTTRAMIWAAFSSVPICWKDARKLRKHPLSLTHSLMCGSCSALALTAVLGKLSQHHCYVQQTPELKLTSKADIVLHDSVILQLITSPVSLAIKGICPLYKLAQA